MSRSKPITTNTGDTPKCAYCGSTKHVLSECTDDACTRSKLSKEERAARREQGDVPERKPVTKPAKPRSFHSSNKKSSYSEQHNTPSINNLSQLQSISNPLGNIKTNPQINSLSATHDPTLVPSPVKTPSSNDFIHILFEINGISLEGMFDSGAALSVITKDLADQCSMLVTDDFIHFKSANNSVSQTLGRASGTLSFRLGSIANLVHIQYSLPIIPGSNKMLIGLDLLERLGLRTDTGLVIQLDKEHKVLLTDDSEFDHKLVSISSLSSTNQRPFDDWCEYVSTTGCMINLDCTQRTKTMLNLFMEFKEVFAEVPHREGIDCAPMSIPFHNASVIVRKPPRRLNPVKQRIAEEIFDELVRSDFAEYTEPVFSSPIVLVIYPDHRKPRLTGDFSGSGGVNDNSIPVEAQLPRISEVIEFLSQAKFIATFDLPKAFWQLKVTEKDRIKTTLSIHGKSIKFKRACFGLKNVPAIFQNIMVEIFQAEGIFIYIDDIIVIGNTFDQFIERIHFVLTQSHSRRVNIGLRKTKVVTDQHEIQVLGTKFMNRKRSIAQSRIDALINLPKPTNVKEVRSLIGSINFIRDWLPGISDLIQPIINFIKQDSKSKGPPKSIKWNDSHDALLDQIKHLIASNIPLALPDPDKHILISCDASDLAVGGTVWMEIPPNSPTGTPLRDRKVLPLSFYSKILSPSQQRWSTMQKELYAILLILTESTLSNYLLTRQITVFTDHKNLAYLISAPEKNRIVKRWIPVLSEFHIDVVHTPGEDNHWADMLSRFIPKREPHDEVDQVNALRDESSIQLLSGFSLDFTEDDMEFTQYDTNSILNLTPVVLDDLPMFSSWISKIRLEQLTAIENNDPLLSNVSIDPNSQLYLSNKGKIIIPEALRNTILYNLHGLTHAGHPSAKDSLDRLAKSDFVWPGMHKDMKRHVATCPSCQKTAPVPRKQLPSTGSPWADKPFAKMHVDTIGPLPADNLENKYLVVFIDAFTRYSILVPLIDLNANETANALIWNVCSIFGIPYKIHSDNGPEFANATFIATCNLLDIEVSKSIPMLSQSNGLVERRHRDILQSLRKILVDFNDFDNWSSHIPLVQLIVNTNRSRVTGFTPFELMFGTNTDPRGDPSRLLTFLKSSQTSELAFLTDLNLKLNRLQTKEKKQSHLSFQSNLRLPGRRTPSALET
ncbi:hypothetical protein GEMRC1_010811 [Eukaryota sp. GEM-RC1]